MAFALCFLAALLPLKSQYEISPINDPSLGVACLLQISNLLRGALLSLLGNEPGLQLSEIRSFLSIFHTSNSFFPRTLTLLTHVLTLAMISPHVLSPLFHFAFTIHTKSEPLRTSAKSI